MVSSGQEYSVNGTLPDAKTVDDVIVANDRLLRFPPALESMFERETGLQRCRELISRAYIGIFVYNLFAISDWFVTPELFATTFVMRLLVFTPAAFAFTALLYLSPRPFLRETIICVGAGLLSTATIIYLLIISKSPPPATLYESITLVVLYLTVVQRVRFWYVLPTSLALMIVHIYALAQFYNFSIGEQIATNMGFGGIVIFSLVASYTMERDLRLHYLLTLRGRAQNYELDRMSRHDPLTALGNRRSLEEALTNFGHGHQNEFSIVLLDIDHFKMFNDGAGHQAGDICLKRIAGIILAELRGHTDHAYRFGGEEFIILLPQTPLPQAITIAERMRRSIETAAIPHPALTSGSVVTASFGVASAALKEEMSAGDVVAAADAALYTAKGNGRNQVYPAFFTSIAKGGLQEPASDGRRS